MRPEEERARSLLEETLRASHQIHHIRPGDEPPDYYFTIDGVEYAVEVTSLHRARLCGRRVVSQLGEHTSVSRWVETIEKEAQETGVLQGKYVLVISGDLVRLLDERKTLDAGIHRFLKQTREEETVERVDIFTGKRLRVRLSKYSSSGSRLSHLYTSSGWAAEIRSVAKDILANALGNKTRKLAKIGYPCILVVHNRYPLAELDDFIVSYVELGDTFFSAVYVIVDNQCVPLKPL